MDAADGFLTSRLGLRSSRVSSNSVNSDYSEREQLISTSETGDNRNLSRKSQGRQWKAKREDDDYVFDDTGAIPLQRPKTLQPIDQCVEADILPDDTIAKIALRYNVQISELKRVNNLLTDAEFHALKRIKIPTKASSLLTAILPEASTGTLGRLGGETKNSDGWYVKSRMGTNPYESQYLSDEASSPLSASGNSSEVEVGELISLGKGTSQSWEHASSTTNNNTTTTSKQAKRVNRILKNVDKDLARIKEREASVSPEQPKSKSQAGDSTISVPPTASPTMSNGGGNYFFDSNSTLSSNMSQTKELENVIHATGGESHWCSRSGLCCLGFILTAVAIICLIAYHFDHSKLFISDPTLLVEHAPGIEHHNPGAEEHRGDGSSHMLVPPSINHGETEDHRIT